MNIIVLGGFLGSGKTSLLLSIAEYISGKESAYATRLAIIENEIGKAAIDDAIIRANGYSVKSLFSGCICCSLSGDLISTLNEISSTINLEWVIVETTGLAYPASICRKILDYADGINSLLSIVVIDGQRWKRLDKSVPDLVRGQVEGADVLLVNKCDLLNNETISVVHDELSLINNEAEMFFVSAKRGIAHSVWTGIIHV
jgi:G3E family GTPase